MAAPIDTARMLRHQLAPHWNIQSPYQWGVVHAIHAGASNTVDLYLDGSSSLTTGIHYLSSYTPTVGDAVMVARAQGSSQTVRVVLGKLA